MTPAEGLLGTLRRVWIPLFLLACAAFMAMRADEMLSGMSMPRLHSPAWLGLLLALQAGVWWLLVSGWRDVVRLRLGTQIGFKPALVHFALFSIGKYLPGKIWGLLARASDMTRDGVDAPDSADIALYEQIAVLHAAALLAIILGAILFPGPMTWSLLALGAMSAVLAPRLSGIALTFMRWAISRARGKPGSHAPAIPLDGHFRLLAWYGLAWTLHGLVLVAVHLSTSPDPFGVAASTIGLLMLANTVGMLAGFAAVFAPAGFGVREAAMAAILATGLGLQDAVILSVLMRLWTLAADTLLASALFLNRRGA